MPGRKVFSTTKKTRTRRRVVRRRPVKAPKPRPSAWLASLPPWASLASGGKLRRSGQNAIHGLAIGVSIIGVALFVIGVSTPPVQPMPTRRLAIDELKYRVLAAAGDIVFCDRDFYPVARLNGEQIAAIDRFPVIRKNAAQFSAIVKRLGLGAGAGFTPAEELAVYREYKKLAALPLTALPDGYAFEYHVPLTGGPKTAELVAGMVSLAGEVRVTERQPSYLNCPI